MMKVCVLFLLAALPALCQFGNATRLQNQPIKPGMTCSDAYVVTWVTAHGQFECLPASGAPSGAAGGVLGGTYPSPTFAGGASFNANAATFLNGAGSFTSPGTANARITFSNVASATMTLTGVAVKAVVTCWDSSVSPARLFIPDSVEQTDADTLTFNFSPNATGYCDGSTGVGLTGATGPTGPAGGVASVFGSTGVITTLANPTFTGTMTVGTSLSVDGITGIAASSKLAGVTLSTQSGIGSFNAGVPNGFTNNFKQVQINPPLQFNSFSQTDLNDLTLPSRTYTDTTNPNSQFTIAISSTGTPDQFMWGKNDYTNPNGPVSITGGVQTLSDGVQIQFGATTGHTQDTNWKINTAECYRAFSSPAGINPPQVVLGSYCPNLITSDWDFVEEMVAPGSSQYPGVVIKAEGGGYLKIQSHGDNSAQLFFSTSGGSLEAEAPSANNVQASLWEWDVKTPVQVAAIAQYATGLSGALIPTSAINPGYMSWKVGNAAGDTLLETRFDKGDWAMPAALTVTGLATATDSLPVCRHADGKLYNGTNTAGVLACP